VDLTDDLCKDFTIQGSEFREYANFKDSKFGGFSQFRNSWFNKEVIFSNAVFSRLVNFSDSRFDEDIAFVNADFIDPVIFYDSKFKGDVHFDHSKFNRNAIFTSSNFGFTWFYKYTDFNHVRFHGTAQFNKIYFANMVDFRDVRFNGFVDFEDTQFMGDALFQNATFRDGISLRRTQYTKFFISFDSIKDGIEYDPESYQLLLKNYNNIGLFSDDDCYFQFMKKQLKHRNPLNSPLIFIFDLATYLFYGYGVRASYPAGWSALIVALFGIYWREKGVKDPFRFSILLFLSGTKLFIESPKRPSEHKGSWLKDMFTMEKILGAVFSVLLLLTISKIIIRS
jgi:Pentapeptide repeats (9 copies)